MPHAVLRILGELDFEKLRKSSAAPRLKPIDWKNLEEWALIGKNLDQDMHCMGFRKRVARLLREENRQKECEKFIKNSPRNDQAHHDRLATAIRTASSMGLQFDVNQPVHVWALSLLHGDTHFGWTELNAAIKLDLRGRLGVAVLSRTGPTGSSGATYLYQKEQKQMHYQSRFKCVSDQPAVSNEAVLAIAVLHESADDTHHSRDNSGNLHREYFTNTEIMDMYEGDNLGVWILEESDETVDRVLLERLDAANQNIKVAWTAEVNTDAERQTLADSCWLRGYQGAPAAGGLATSVASVSRLSPASGSDSGTDSDIETLFENESQSPDLSESDSPGDTGCPNSFKILKDRCHQCAIKCTRKNALKCICGVLCCKPCSGTSGSVSRGLIYACDQCRQGYIARYGTEKLLKPDPSFVLCGRCGCDTQSVFYCQVPGRCSKCWQVFCEQCTGLSSHDKINSPLSRRALEQSRKSAVKSFECMSCTGREAYVQGRRGVLIKLFRNLFSDTPSNPFDMEYDKMKLCDLRAKKSLADAIGDLVHNVRYIGLRALFEECLPVLMRIVKRQMEFKLPVCVSPFNMLLYSRTRKTPAESGADGTMLESICRAHAEAAMKVGQELLRDHQPPSQGRQLQGGVSGDAGANPAKRVVVFYGPDLLKHGPLVNLVGMALVSFAKDARFDTWICANEPADLEYPPVHDLHAYFKQRDRLLLFKPDFKPVKKLELLLGVGLDAVISFPGWTWGDIADVLYALSQHGKLIFNTLGYAGPMHFPEAITATLVGGAVGKSQMQSSSREAFALYDYGDCYQPPQSHPYLMQVPSSSRSDFNLPEDAFIAVCQMCLDRLEPESISFFVDFLQRVLFGWIVFVLRPSSMREQILEWIDDHVRSLPGCNPDIKDRILFRPRFRDSQGLYQLLNCADVSLDSFGNYSAQTTASDALMCKVPHFGPNDPEGLMQSRVGAEVSIAAGLEKVCVGKTGEETIDLLVEYAHDQEAQTRVRAFIAQNRQDKKGLFCERRSHLSWIAVLQFYLDEKRTNPEIARFPDFKIPPHGSIVSYADPAAVQLQAILSQMGCAESEVPELHAMMRAIQLEARVEFIQLEGSGTSMHTIRCIDQRSGTLVALQVSKKSRPRDRMHNDTAVRKVANNMLWHQRTRNTEIKSLIPEPCYLLDGGTSCLGISKPNAEDRVFSFLFIEFIEGLTFSKLRDQHSKWQDEGIFTDALRLEMFNPLSQGVCLLGFFGLSILNIKFENVMMRTNGPHKGTIAFLNTGHGHTFTRSSEMKSQQDTKGQPTLLNRRCTSQMRSSGAKKARRLLRPLQPKRDQQIVGITRKQIQEFLSKAAKEDGLAIIGSESSAEMFAGKNVQRESAFAADHRAVHEMLLRTLTLRNEETIADWNARLKSACGNGEEGLREMLMASSGGCPGQVEQPMAFKRAVDFFVGVLGPGKARNAVDSMTHGMNTLPILPATDEKTLKEEGCIKLPQGFLTPPGQSTIKCPPLSFAEQAKGGRSKGIGVRAEEDIQPGTIIGPYAGEKVANSEIGRPYLSLQNFPSRFVAVVQGDIPALRQSTDTKASVDGQVTAIRDWQWVKIKNNVGPFLNAPDAGESDDEVNCILDRHSLWVDAEGVHWMLMKSSKLIPKGTFLQWKYDPKAGPGGFWKLS